MSHGGETTALGIDLQATFSDDEVVFEVAADLGIEDGETLVVLGPSGSGKTLLLETVAGFHDHAGTVRLGDRDLTQLPPEARGFGFVFQDYALFPHVSVHENVDFGTRYHEDTGDPDAVLADLGISHLADRDPETLSGGEKQRVALARSLVVNPAALLLDEPLSALDVPTRQSLRDDLADVLADVTALYVTHNRTTARALADRIAVMSDGEVVQTGSPEEVFEHPATPFVARFTGSNCLRVGDLPFDPGTLTETGSTPGRDDAVAIRPEHVVVSHVGASSDAEGRVERVLREDAAHRITVSVGAAAVEAFVDDPPPVGETVGIAFPSERVTVLDGEEWTWPAD